MFARASSKKDHDNGTHIPKDVADLIDEIDKVAAPFDESEMKEDEDALLVDGAADATLLIQTLFGPLHRKRNASILPISLDCRI